MAKRPILKNNYAGRLENIKMRPFFHRGELYTCLMHDMLADPAIYPDHLYLLLQMVHSVENPEHQRFCRFAILDTLLSKTPPALDQSRFMAQALAHKPEDRVRSFLWIYATSHSPMDLARARLSAKLLVANNQWELAAIAFVHIGSITFDPADYIVARSQAQKIPSSQAQTTILSDLAVVSCALEDFLIVMSASEHTRDETIILHLMNFLEKRRLLGLAAELTIQLPPSQVRTKQHLLELCQRLRAAKRQPPSCL